MKIRYERQYDINREAEKILSSDKTHKCEYRTGKEM